MFFNGFSVIVVQSLAFHLVGGIAGSLQPLTQGQLKGALLKTLRPDYGGMMDYRALLDDNAVSLSRRNLCLSRDH